MFNEEPTSLEEQLQASVRRQGQLVRENMRLGEQVDHLIAALQKPPKEMDEWRLQAYKEGFEAGESNYHQRVLELEKEVARLNSLLDVLDPTND